MPARKKLILAVAVAALAVPAVAIGAVIETGGNPNNVAVACPADCVVLAKVSGYQNKTGTTLGPLVASQSGRIVAWTVTLGKPNSTQTKFFEDESALGEATANITVLRPGKSLMHKIVQQGPSLKLTKYFGRTVTFPLVRTLSIRKGDIVALTTKTWIPIMAVNQPGTTSWRASRPKGSCDDTSGKDYSQTTINRTTQFRCLYRGVQLLYGATIIPNPPKK